MESLIRILLLGVLVAQCFAKDDDRCASIFKGGKSVNLGKMCFSNGIKKMCPDLISQHCTGVTKPPPPKPTTAPKKVPAAAAVPDPTKNARMQRCCKAMGLSSACMNFCVYEADKPAQIACNSDCVSHYPIINYCASNGKDNTQCCKSNIASIQPMCLQMCSGNAPSVSTMFQNPSVAKSCFDESYQIFQCHKQNSGNSDGWSTSKTLNVAPVPSSANQALDLYCVSQGGGNPLSALGGGTAPKLPFSIPGFPG